MRDLLPSEQQAAYMASKAAELETLGENLTQQGKYSAAANALKLCADLNPASKTRLLELAAQNYREGGDLKNAANVFRDAAGSIDGHTLHKADLYLEAAKCHSALGDGWSTVQICDEAVTTMNYLHNIPEPQRKQLMLQARLPFADTYLDRSRFSESADCYLYRAELLAPAEREAFLISKSGHMEQLAALGGEEKASEAYLAAARLLQGISSKSQDALVLKIKAADAAALAFGSNQSHRIGTDNYVRLAKLMPEAEREAFLLSKSQYLEQLGDGAKTASLQVHYYTASRRLLGYDSALNERNGVTPRDTSLLLKTGDAAASAQEFALASNTYFTLAKMMPESEREAFLLSKAEHFEKLGDTEQWASKAEEAYSAAFRIREATALPVDSGLLVKWANALATSQSFNAAVDKFNAASELMPAAQRQAFLLSKSQYLEQLGDKTTQNKAGAYEAAAKLVTEIDQEIASSLYEKAGNSYFHERKFQTAAERYGLSSRIAPSQLLIEKQFACAIFSGQNAEPAFLDVLRSNGASERLCSLLEGISDFGRSIITQFSFAPNFSQLERTLEVLHNMENEVGINPARRQSTHSLISAGFQEWMKNGFENPQGIPDCFLFQTLAVVHTPEQLAAMAKVLGIKKLRESKDARKSLMWYLEDNVHKEKRMQDFFHLIQISSEKKFVENLRLLPMVYLVEPSFDMSGITSTEAFKSRADALIEGFARQISHNDGVVKAFAERRQQLYEEGFLIPLITLYSQYSHYKELKPLLDMAFSSVVMGEFEKIKFPSEEQINKMDYLSQEQKNLLITASHQLDFLGERMRKQWAADVLPVKSIAGESVDIVAQARQDMAQRIADMKYHFGLHLREQKGELEQEFAFSEGYIAKLRSQIEAEQNGSPQFIKLKHIERIISSVLELESIDAGDVKEKKEQVTKCLRDIGQSTKGLFTKFYGLDEEGLNSLQAKIDVDHMRNLLLGSGANLFIKSLTAYESSDPTHLINAGKLPENSGSCQRYDGTPSLMMGLSGYFLNSNVKIIRVENQDWVVVGRAMLKAVQADGEPALVVERAYYIDGKSDPNIDNAIIELATKKAQTLGIPLLTAWRSSPNQRSMHISRQQGLSPYEYSDAFGGVKTGNLDITQNLNILYAPQK